MQFAYYGAYFSLAIPAALINRRYDYKAGVLPGLGLATLAFIVPAICLAVVACYALFDLRTARHGGALASEGAGL